jgi:Matrixin
MPAHPADSRPAGSPGGRPTLLGWYQRPALHLVGAPQPPSLRSPGQWQPGPPPLQYGVDFSFARRCGPEPVRWRRGLPVTIRITGADPADPDPSAAAALATVIAELRTLTGSDLMADRPRAGALNPDAVPDQEIHVGYLEGREMLALSGRKLDCAGLGGARLGGDTTSYAAGFAAVNTDLTGADATGAYALAVLRHELAHALGLGHAGRRSLLMNRQITADTTQFGRGDRHGLALLGSAAPVSGTPRLGQQPSLDLRTLPLCTA